ncbi:MAG: hypothetical protein ACLFNO_03755 [Parcubacteria group bacterium]
MSKRQLRSSKGDVRKITNSLSKCICGHFFDQDGVCANGHFQDEEYFISGNLQSEKKKENSSLKKEGTCQPFANRCNICGTYIPEGDNVCEHGHVIGVTYSKN